MFKLPKMRSVIALAASLLSLVTAAPSATIPTVQLDYAKVIGYSYLGVDSFKGIPYAKPPTGQLRLKPPQAITSNLGTVMAISDSRACPQFLTTTYGTGFSMLPRRVLAEVYDSGFLQGVGNEGEDCLTVNVQRPSNATAGAKLPVVFWMYGGGFSFGATQMYDASELISTSVTQGKPIIYVSVNYRVGGFGWLPGKEILKDGSANLGHLDQRLALQWVADNIEKFGGDPEKVVIWGESAGSISVFNQMALYNGNNTYKGKPLFRGAIMDSGSTLPADPVDGVKGQAIYDMVVKNAGCRGRNDTLACLRSVSYNVFLSATTSVPSILSYSSVALSYLPRPDNKTLMASAEVILQSGQYAAVPFIIGNQEDEGTLFALYQFNLTTTSDLVKYFKDIYFFGATQQQIETLVATYPDDPTAGSPFNTGFYNILFPQYKRLAAILGDTFFTLARRVTLNYTTILHPTVPSWSYLASYLYGTPTLGTFHSSDILTTYGNIPGVPTNTIQSFYISFINTLDPNNGTKNLLNWPTWSNGSQLMHLWAYGNELIKDDFRNSSYDFLLGAAGSLHI